MIKWIRNKNIKVTLGSCTKVSTYVSGYPMCRLKLRISFCYYFTFKKNTSLNIINHKKYNLFCIVRFGRLTRVYISQKRT